MAFSTVEAVTTSNLVIGRSSAVGGSARLVDVLNQEERLVLTESKVYPLRREGGPISFGVTCSIARNRIIWARPIGEAANNSRRQATQHDRIEKSPHPVSVLAPPFRIQGFVHIPDSVDISLAAGWLARGYLPITSARVVVDGETGLEWDAPVIAVNGTLADVISVEAPAAAPPVTLHTFLEAS